LLSLIWTAGLIPEALAPSNAAALFTKPAPRWLFLAGKFAGVVVIVAGLTAFFFLGTWFALGFRTGEWDHGYLAGIPLLLLQFVSLYSVSVLLAVMTRSAAACVLGTLLVWALAVGINYGRHAAVALPHLGANTPTLSPFTLFLVDAAYWMLPKPLDCQMLLEQALGAGAHLATLSSLPEFARVREAGEFFPSAAVFTSLLFSVVVLALAGRQLRKVEY
jgi:hypothetical protein